MQFLEKGIYRLLQSEPFYAHFILNSRILFDYKKDEITTAAAATVNGTTVLIFNSEFMNSLPLPEVVSILKHEILHLLLNHTKGRFDIKNNGLDNPHNLNIAMDCAINQHIQNLPKKAVTLESLQKCVKVKLEAFQTAEYYFDAIKDHSDQSKISKMNTLDNHNPNIPDKDTTPEQQRVAVQSTASKALTQAKGNVSNNLLKVLTNLNQESKVNWKQILRNFVSRSTSSFSINTRKKVNRRFDLDFPGKKKKRELTLGVCVDSSGSISDEQYMLFLNEVSFITKDTALVYLIHADSEVNKVDTLKKKKIPPRERHGNGGTAYGPALKKSVELGCDAVIYFGDMDCADIPENPGKPVLWVTVSSEDKPGNFGHILRLE